MKNGFRLISYEWVDRNDVFDLDLLIKVVHVEVHVSSKCDAKSPRSAWIQVADHQRTRLLTASHTYVVQYSTVLYRFGKDIRPEKAS